jgi:hypothetical protein
LKHMPKFRKNIYVGEEEMNFMFTQLNYPDGIGYFITVTDKNKNIYALDLKRTGGNEWKVVKKDNLPAWILDVEPLLVESIKQGRSAHHFVH